MTNRYQSRYRAYHYVIEQAKKANQDPPINSDERLAAVFDISPDELKSLREGLSDPSQKLVAEFKKLFGPINEAEIIDSYLVTPFLTKP